MADELSTSIRDGTFIDSIDLLNSSATPDLISALLVSIGKSKDKLRDEIQEVSKSESSNVDEWISQAKKIQTDIARCKSEARQIVEEHKRVENLRSAAQDANNKVQLLETEIAFTTTLEHEIQSITEITQTLSEAQTALADKNISLAVGKAVSLQPAIRSIAASQTRLLLLKLDDELRRQCQERLIQLLDASWSIETRDDNIVLTNPSSQQVQDLVKTGSDSISTTDILMAMKELGTLSAAGDLILRKIETLLRSFTLPNSSRYLFPVQPFNHTNEKGTTNKTPTLDETMHALEITKALLTFLQTNLPDLIKDSVAHELCPKFVTSLISDWLDPALPHEVVELRYTGPLRQAVGEVAAQLQRYTWPGDVALAEWVTQLPRKWLTKRRMASLDGVRMAFSLARGQLRSEERVERQTITNKDAEEVNKSHGAEEDDWNSNWDDDPSQPPDPSLNEANDEEASGWDFETESNHSDSRAKNTTATNANDEDDAGDAWGWNDDEGAKENVLDKDVIASERTKANGNANAGSDLQEMVLRETYYITDIPDFILEIVGKDLTSVEMLRSTDSHHFDDDSAANGLAALPNLTLAFFRATASTYYLLPSATYPLTNMNLYNDTLYIAQRLSEMSDATSIESSIQSLQKFARQVYTSELDIQRTVLNDLLDGAQGFERCTTFPQSQSCNAAVASVTDRLRQLHATWSTILGESHLLQSLGTLLTMVFGKMVKDIEDMEDISEAESKQLVTYCQEILNLEDLFVSQLPNLTQMGQPEPPSETETTPSSQILLYVPNYLRFQYLQQILESSLVDIKYLWTEGELSLEFHADEVVDLIKALFAESQHRRNAIRAIRGSAV